MADHFRRFIDRVLSHEGGFTDDPRDPGNWTGGVCGVGVCKGTKFGIAANTYGALDIRNLTRDQAIEIYRRDFWNAVGADRLPPAVGFQLLDAAVNHGVNKARQLLQRAVRVADDGKIGPVTLAAIAAMSPDDLLLRFIGERIEFYTMLEKFGTFGRGWMRRIAVNLLHAAEDN